MPVPNFVLKFKRWIGRARRGVTPPVPERFTHQDANRITGNANAIAQFTGRPIKSYVTQTQSGMADYDEYNKLEDHTVAISSANGVSLPTPPEQNWAPFRGVSFGDFQRQERNLWTLYEKMGGSGLMQDSDIVATVRIYASEWAQITDGWTQTVLCPIATPTMNGVASFSTWLNNSDAKMGIASTPFVSAVGAGTITVVIYGSKPTQDINMEVHRRDDVMIKTATLTTAGWTTNPDGTFNQTVAVTDITSTSEGVVGYGMSINKDTFIDAQRCMIRVSGQANNSITFTAREKPAYLIPIEIQLTTMEA